MQITVTVPDAFAEEVQTRGLTPQRYVEALIAARAGSTLMSGDTAARLADLEQFFKEMAANLDNHPILSGKALTRESFYQDHDQWLCGTP